MIDIFDKKPIDLTNIFCHSGGSHSAHFYVAKVKCFLMKRRRAEGADNQELSKKLGIETIHFTNREMKFSYIINLGVDRHFENDDYEVQLINQVCKERNYKCLLVPVEDLYWRYLVY